MKVDISAASVFRMILIILMFLLLYLLKDVLIIFFFALIIASAISPFAAWLDEKGFPRLLGILLLYLIIIGLVIFVLSLVVPFVSEDLNRLVGNLPALVNKVSGSIDAVQQGSPRYLDFLSEIQNLLESLSSYFQQASRSAFSLISSIFGGILSAVAILIISFYLAVTKKGVESFINAVVPDHYEDYVLNLWRRSELKVGRWLQGQLLLALVVGLVVYVGLSLMGIRFALLLGIVAMLFELVPIVGPVLAAIPAVILAFVQNPTLGLWVLIFYIVVQQLENHILVPVVLGKTTGLNPIVVIIALLVGQQLAGIPGMILSVPVATIIVEMVEDLAKQKRSRRANL